MKPLDPGIVLDALARRGSPTVVHLSRPFDIAPEHGTRWTVPELADLVRATAARLAAAGVGPGEYVAVVKRNHWDYVLLACAAARIGAVPALLSDHVDPGTLDTLLGRLRPAVLVTDTRVLRAAVAAGVDPTRHAARTVTLDGAVSAVRGGDVLDFHRLPARPPAPIHYRSDGRPLAVHHTSGTTGVPKLVVHSTTTLIRRLAGFEALPWPVVTARRTDSVASAIAFAHGRALSWTVSTLWHQPREVVIVDDTDPETARRTLGAHPPTVVEALPSTYQRWQRLAAGPRSPFGDVRLYVSTFDAVHPPTVRAFLDSSHRRAPLWMQGWGQTETGPLTFRILTRRSLARRAERHPTTRNLGRPVPGWVGLRIVDPQTLAPVPRGRLGLVLTRTGARCLGYLGEEQRWQEKLHGPWFNTGDLAVRTRSGVVHFLDREVDMIPGLSCVEIEDVLHERLPEVEEAVVLGGVDRVPQPVLVVNAPVDRGRWLAAVSDLPALAEPLVLDWDAVPRTGTGKVRRHELRERHLAGSLTHGTGQWT
ncbi:class I adenylate-forming enzyme family protein [Streptacidiphilus anmyonensis]|uniref:class I adenylate-forming enzyme family protein n=1 Tax=Streptacidiphilus anmyonensis TaxID=405782 RepID=UPI0005A6336D|nr:class I adenylate-forming enzyme family protein [Streptacidiphilus anmyonensis]